MKESSAEVIYVIGAKSWQWLVAAALIGAAILLQPGISERWPSGNWSSLLPYIPLVLPLLVSALKLFLRKTWLSTQGFHQRDLLGRITFVPYMSIQEFVFESSGGLAVKYQGDERLEVAGSKEDLDTIVRLAGAFLSTSVRLTRL